REVLAQGLGERWGAKSRRRMKEREEEGGAPADLVHLRGASHPGDPRAAAREQLGGEVAEGGDHARLDELHLTVEVRLAGLDLDRLGIAVAGRAALEHVADPDIASLHADARQQFGEQRAGAADERQSL